MAKPKKQTNGSKRGSVKGAKKSAKQQHANSVSPRCNRCSKAAGLAGAPVISSTATAGARYMTQSNPHAQFGCGKTVVPARTEAPWKLRRRYEGLGAHLPFLSKLAKSRGEKAELLLSRAHGTVFRIIKKLNDDLLNLRLVPKNLPRLRKKLSQYEDLTCRKKNPFDAFVKFSSAGSSTCFYRRFYHW